jgi:hypothetical protein
MPVVVATRFKPSSPKYLPRFFAGTVAAARQARSSSGFLGGRLRIDSVGAFWTLSVWESGGDMVAFRDSGVHAVLVPKLAGWANEAVYGVWNADTGKLPGWAEVSRHVAAHPNFGPLDHPGPAHLAQRFDPASRFGLELPIPRTLSAPRRTPRPRT